MFRLWLRDVPSNVTAPCRELRFSGSCKETSMRRIFSILATGCFLVSAINAHAQSNFAFRDGDRVFFPLGTEPTDGAAGVRSSGQSAPDVSPGALGRASPGTAAAGPFARCALVRSLQQRSSMNNFLLYDTLPQAAGQLYDECSACGYTTFRRT